MSVYKNTHAEMISAMAEAIDSLKETLIKVENMYLNSNEDRK